MLRSLPSRRPAYTLTEILVVIGIICILAALSFSFFHIAGRKARHYEAIAEVAKSHVEKSHAQALAPGASSLASTPAIHALAHGGPIRAGAFGFGSGAGDNADPQAAPPAALTKEQLPAVPDEYIITFAASVKDPKAEAARMADQYGGKVLRVFNKIVAAAALRIPADKFDAFRADQAINTFDRNYFSKKFQQKTPTGVRRMFSYPTLPPSRLVLHRPAPHTLDRNLFYKKKAMANMATIAIVDSGIDSRHPELNVTLSLGFDGLPNGEDQDGHGTHVAGIAAARENAQGVVGVYPGAPLWSIRVLDATGTGTLLGFLEGIFYVYENADKVHVCNISAGFLAVVPIVNLFVDACVYQGVVMVCAGGNSSVQANTFSPAGSTTQAICVAALADSDGRRGGIGPVTSSGPDDTFANFSNFGSGVTVIAPGVDIYSTVPGNAYGIKSGTSMAAPHIAGLCALLYDANTIFGQKSRNLIFRSHPATALNMRSYLRSIATEQIPGINGDTLKYPLINLHVE